MDKSMDEVIVGRMKTVLAGLSDDAARGDYWGEAARQTIEVRDHVNRSNAIGYYDRSHATSYCSYASCEREVAFSAKQWKQSNPPDGHAQSIFLTGLHIEAKLKALIVMAGFNVAKMNAFPLYGWIEKDSHQVYVQPDMVLCLNGQEQHAFEQRYGFWPGAWVSVEIKTISHYGFRDVGDQGTKVAKPGYYDQAQLEMEGSYTDTCILIYEDKSNQQLLEDVVQKDTIRLEALYTLFGNVCETKDPFEFERDRSHQLIPRTTFQRGKKRPVGAKDGEERYDKNDKHIGWDIVIGQKLPWSCGYCSWRDNCWAPMTFERLFEAGKTVFSLKEEEVTF